jgi:predicted Zn finger-like uncharacterized protein
MIAACPKCHTRYRVQPEQLGPDGARLRCSSCNAVFRVRPPAAKAAAAAPRLEAAVASPPPASVPPAVEPPPASPAAAPAPPAPVETAHPPRHLFESDPPEPGPRFDRERLVVVAHADPDVAKAVAEALEGWGLEALVAHDGVEAMLGIQRALPSAVVLDAALPKMYGFQVCEIVKRNESLRETRVVLVGAIHKEERYRRAPRDLYGADVYVEPPDLPDALFEILTRFGLPVRSDSAPGPHAVRSDAPSGHLSRGGSAALRDSRTEPLLSESAPPAIPPSRSSAQGMPSAGGADALGGEARSRHGSEASARRGEAERSRSDGEASEVDSSAPASPADPLAAERAKAERLARIIVSDIVLYNPEKFAAAARSGGDVAAAMRDELAEGRALFRERIDARVRAERDHLAEELARVAKARSGQ